VNSPSRPNSSRATRRASAGSTGASRIESTWNPCSAREQTSCSSAPRAGILGEQPRLRGVELAVDAVGDRHDLAQGLADSRAS
jgi:hypothetical protein